jgi:hypothetical protein
MMLNDMIAELRPGNTYFIKIAKRSYELEAHKTFLAEARKKNVTILTMLVEDEKDVAIEFGQRMKNLMMIDWVSYIGSRFNIISKYLPGAELKKNAIVSEMSVQVKAKIKEAVEKL